MRVDAFKDNHAYGLKTIALTTNEANVYVAPEDNIIKIRRGTSTKDTSPIDRVR